MSGGTGRGPDGPPRKTDAGSDGPKLTTTEDVLLEALASLMVDGKIRVSLLHLEALTGRSHTAITKASKGLEAKGEVIVRRGSSTRGANVYGITKQGVRTLQRRSPVWATEWTPLPDAFRVRDFTNPGVLWQRAPKGEAMTRAQVWEYMPTADKASVSGWLQRLEDLPTPFVTSEPNPGRNGHKLYTFHDMDDAGQAINLAHLSERLKQWNPVTRKEREDQHDGQRTQLMLGTGQLNYDNVTAFIEENTTRTEFGCEVGPKEWQDKDGYIRVPGIANPGVRGHRIMYRAKMGPIPYGHELHHFYCNNRACMNPRHLAEVTPGDHREHTASWAPYRGKDRSVSITYTDPHADD